MRLSVRFRDGRVVDKRIEGFSSCRAALQSAKSPRVSRLTVTGVCR